MFKQFIARIGLKKIFIAAIGLNLILIIIGVFYLISSYNKIIVKLNQPLANTRSTPTPTPTPDPLAPYAILLLEYGGGNHEGGLLTDSIIVARVEPRNQKIILISIPRDLWVPLPLDKDSTTNYKVNAAYAIGSDDRQYPDKKIEFTGPAGGGQMAKTVISQVLGFNIDYFVAVDFQAFIRIIDNLGGISVNVQKTFDDFLYPIEENINETCGKSDEEIAALTATLSGQKLDEQFTCRYETLHFERGLNVMDGTTALKFARSRHSLTDGGDFNRTARQKLIIDAVRQKIININFIPKIIPLIQTLSSHLQTDIEAKIMEQFIAKYSQLSQYQISSLALTDQNVLENGISSNGQYVLLPKAGENNWTQIHQFILDPTLLTPTPTIRPSPKPLPTS